MKTEKAERAIDYLKNTEHNFEGTNLINEIIFDSINKENPPNDSITKLLIQNKFLNLEWKIIFEDTSDEIKNISLIKILIKIHYLNISKMQKEYLCLLMDKEQFEKFLLEFEALQKAL